MAVMLLTEHVCPGSYPEVSEAIGKHKTGIRISPYGIYNDMPHYTEIDATYTY